MGTSIKAAVNLVFKHRQTGQRDEDKKINSING